MVDGIVDLLDSRLKTLAGQPVVSAEFVLEIVHGGLKVFHIDLLVSYLPELPPVFQGITGGVAQHGDGGDKELGPDHVHLFVPVGYIHNAAVI